MEIVLKQRDFGISRPYFGLHKYAATNSSTITSAAPERFQMEAAESFHRLVGLFDKHGSRISPRRRELHGLRDLDRSTDLGFFLFGLFNPVVTSMRALCAATHLRRVSKVLDLEDPVAISGFSDAQHVFAPEILEPVHKELLIESLAKQTSPAKSKLPT